MSYPKAKTIEIKIKFLILEAEKLKKENEKNTPRIETLMNELEYVLETVSSKEIVLEKVQSIENELRKMQ